MSRDCRLPATYHLNAYRGDTWAQTFRFLHDGMLIDLATATVACWVRQRDQRTTLACEVSGPGQVTIAMVVGAELDPGAYAYDVEVADADGSITTWVRGRLNVARDVTNELAQGRG